MIPLLSTFMTTSKVLIVPIEPTLIIPLGHFQRMIPTIELRHQRWHSKSFSVIIFHPHTLFVLLSVTEAQNGLILIVVTSRGMVVASAGMFVD